MWNYLDPKQKERGGGLCLCTYGHGFFHTYPSSGISPAETSSSPYNTFSSHVMSSPSFCVTNSLELPRIVLLTNFTPIGGSGLSSSPSLITILGLLFTSVLFATRIFCGWLYPPSR